MNRGLEYVSSTFYEKLPRVNFSPLSRLTHNEEEFLYIPCLRIIWIVLEGFSSVSDSLFVLTLVVQTDTSQIQRFRLFRIQSKEIATDDERELSDTVIPERKKKGRSLGELTQLNQQLHRISFYRLELQLSNLSIP